MDEIWKPVVGYEGFYQVSNTGKVKALRRSGVHVGRWGLMEMNFPERIMKNGTSTNGYMYVKLKHPGENPEHKLIHRLVLEAHHGMPPNDGMHANHIDGDKSNNSLGNLEWCTPLENIRHCIDVLKKKRGEGAGGSKLKEHDIAAIRADGRMLKEIAKDYGVTLQAIHLVKARKNWAHVA